MNSDSPFQEDPVRIAPEYKLLWDESYGCKVLMGRTAMVKLNRSAIEVLQLCTGSLRASEIVAVLSDRFPNAELEQDVRDFLQCAHSAGWICFERLSPTGS